MTALSEAALKGIGAICGENCTPLSVYRVSGGCINNCFSVTTGNGKRLFIKENSAALYRLFREESSGLRVLAGSDGPRVPRVLYVGEDSATQVLILEHIHEAPGKRGFFTDFGRRMADMHRNSVSRLCGFDSDNHIGASVQINTRTDNWIDFFAKYRLVPQTEMAINKGLFDTRYARAMENLIHKLDRYLVAADAPSLIHGDLWGGNFMSDENGEAVLIDPAVSYSHREADIAMTRLFGGFPEEFYRAYNESFPLEPGFPDRIGLYNLYHIINHLNLFGRSYLGEITATLKRYACM